MRLLMLMALLVQPFRTAGAQAPGLPWLAGCWERTLPEGSTREQWTAPRGGAQLGLSHTVRAGATVEYEFLRLFERDGRLVFAAHPSGQVPTEFSAVEQTDSTAVFSNPEHDFPQQIGYRRVGPDSLVAWIEGTTPGGPRTVEFAYGRAACP